MDTYTIGLLILALALINKILDLLAPVVVMIVAVLVVIVIAVIGRRKK